MDKQLFKELKKLIKVGFDRYKADHYILQEAVNKKIHYEFTKTLHLCASVASASSACPATRGVLLREQSGPQKIFICGN